MGNNSPVIKNGNVEAEIAPLGGTAATFSVNGMEIFYPMWITEKRSRGGCPICAPWFGKSPRGEKNHGHLRDLADSGVSVTDNKVESKFSGPQNDLYPWKLNYTTTVLIGPDGTLKIGLEIERMNDKVPGAAPVLPGFHPYFACSDANKVNITIADKKYSGFPEESQMFPVEEPVILIEMPDKKIEMKLEGAFLKAKPCLVMWTDSPHEYICAEPILQDENLFDTPECRYLNENEKISLSVSFKVL
jgi:galactose mutarotase-like enzyme